MPSQRRNHPGALALTSTATRGPAEMAIILIAEFLAEQTALEIIAQERENQRGPRGALTT